jgi:hypothetical protein
VDTVLHQNTEHPVHDIEEIRLWGKQNK